MSRHAKHRGKAGRSRSLWQIRRELMYALDAAKTTIREQISEIREIAAEIRENY